MLRIDINTTYIPLNQDILIPSVLLSLLTINLQTKYHDRYLPIFILASSALVLKENYFEYSSGLESLELDLLLAVAASL